MLVMTTQEFYERVEELMDERGWKRYKLAQESGLPESTLYNMMKRRSEPKLETFLKIVNGFHLTVGEFVHPEKDQASLSSVDWEIIQITKDLDRSAIDRVIGYAKGIKEGKDN